MINPTLVHLAKAIQQGWPESAKDLPDDVKPYFPYKFILHIVDGVIMMDGRIMVPIGLKSKFLQKIHELCLGIVRSKILAKMLVYWPNYSSGVKAMCQECDQCREN